MFCYSNSGYSMRAVDPGYIGVSGEIIFTDYATDAQLAVAFPGYQPVTARTLVSKSTVMARVIAAGKMAQAQTTLWSMPDKFARWFAPDQPSVFADDPDTVAFITSLGLDPKVILAP